MQFTDRKMLITECENKKPYLLNHLDPTRNEAKKEKKKERTRKQERFSNCDVLYLRI